MAVRPRSRHARPSRRHGGTAGSARSRTSGWARKRSPQAGSTARLPADAVRPSLLNLGVEALRQVLAFDAPADAVMRRFFHAHRNLGRRDRGFIAEAVFACLRRLRWYTHLAGSRDARRLFLLAAVRLPAAEQRSLEPAASADEHAWLAATASGCDDALPLGVRAELPDWVIDALRPDTPDDEILQLGRGMQAAAPLDLRVNPLAASREQVMAQLHASGIDAHRTPYSPFGLRLETKPALEQHPLYLSGAIEVQDEGSQLVGLLLAPRRREMVADFCAGAGGKTLLLGALMRSEGRLYAFDVSPHRIRRLHARLARSGLSNVQPETISHENDVRLKRLAGKLDRVLVDAPCTGMGTLRRNPDLKWRQGPEDLAALTQKQALILDAAGRLLKPGGRLVYATCSFLPQENDAIVDDFLARRPDFQEIDAGEILARQGIAMAAGRRMQILPHRHGTDGFYAAVLERIAAR